MITVKNLYYLLLYAWDFFEPDRMTAVDAEPETDLVNLLADVLNRGIDHLLRRGADRGYLPRMEDIPGIRGKLNLSATIKGNLLVRGRTVCQFDELSFDGIEILEHGFSRIWARRSESRPVGRSKSRPPERGSSYVLLRAKTRGIGCGNVGISRSVRDFQAPVEIVL